MSLTIPDNSISGGFTRNYKKNALSKLSHFKLIIDILNARYKNDHIFYITKIRDMYDEFDYLNGDSDRELIYDGNMVNEFITSMLTTIDFDFHVRCLLEQFNILTPLVKSFKYLIDKEDDDIDYSDLLDKVIDYIDHNDIVLNVIVIPPVADEYKNKFYEKIESIRPKHLTKNINVKNIINLLEYNLNQYIRIIDILSEYIADLEQFYIELAGALYDYKLNVR